MCHAKFDVAQITPGYETLPMSAYLLYPLLLLLISALLVHTLW